VRLLVASGLDPSAQDEDGATPLHRAAIWDHVEVMKYLVTSCRVCLASRNLSGETPLHSAAFSGSECAVMWLLSQGADTSILTDNGMTPMDMARTLATRKWIAAVEDGGERPKESEINLALPMSPEEDQRKRELEEFEREICEWRARRILNSELSDLRDEAKRIGRVKRQAEAFVSPLEESTGKCCIVNDDNDKLEDGATESYSSTSTDESWVDIGISCSRPSDSPCSTSTQGLWPEQNRCVLDIIPLQLLKDCAKNLHARIERSFLRSSWPNTISHSVSNSFHGYIPHRLTRNTISTHSRGVLPSYYSEPALPIEEPPRLCIAHCDLERDDDESWCFADCPSPVADEDGQVGTTDRWDKMLDVSDAEALSSCSTTKIPIAPRPTSGTLSLRCRGDEEIDLKCGKSDLIPPKRKGKGLPRHGKMSFEHVKSRLDQPTKASQHGRWTGDVAHRSAPQSECNSGAVTPVRTPSHRTASEKVSRASSHSPNQMAAAVIHALQSVEVEDNLVVVNSVGKRSRIPVSTSKAHPESSCKDVSPMQMRQQAGNMHRPHSVKSLKQRYVGNTPPSKSDPREVSIPTDFKIPSYGKISYEGTVSRLFQPTAASKMGKWTKSEEIGRTRSDPSKVSKDNGGRVSPIGPVTSHSSGRSRSHRTPESNESDMDVPPRSHRYDHVPSRLSQPTKAFEMGRWKGKRSDSVSSNGSVCNSGSATPAEGMDKKTPGEVAIAVASALNAKEDDDESPLPIFRREENRLSHAPRDRYDNVKPRVYASTDAWVEQHRQLQKPSDVLTPEVAPSTHSLSHSQSFALEGHKSKYDHVKSRLFEPTDAWIEYHKNNPLRSMPNPSAPRSRGGNSEESMLKAQDSRVVVSKSKSLSNYEHSQSRLFESTNSWRQHHKGNPHASLPRSNSSSTSGSCTPTGNRNTNITQLTVDVISALEAPDSESETEDDHRKRHGHHHKHSIPHYDSVSYEEVQSRLYEPTRAYLEYSKKGHEIFERMYNVTHFSRDQAALRAVDGVYMPSQEHISLHHQHSQKFEFIKRIIASREGHEKDYKAEETARVDTADFARVVYQPIHSRLMQSTIAHLNKCGHETSHNVSVPGDTMSIILHKEEDRENSSEVSSISEVEQNISPVDSWRSEIPGVHLYKIDGDKQHKQQAEDEDIVNRPTDDLSVDEWSFCQSGDEEDGFPLPSSSERLSPLHAIRPQYGVKSQSLCHTLDTVERVRSEDHWWAKSMFASPKASEGNSGSKY